MKLKEFGPPEGEGARPKFYYVDPPLDIPPICTKYQQKLKFSYKLQY